MNKFKLLLIGFIITSAFGISAQTYEDLVNRSVDYIDAEDYLAAEQTLKTALRKEPANPGNILLMSNLGTVQRHMKKYDEALLSYNVALNNYPNSVILLHNRAALYCEIDSLDSALQDYCSILLSSPEDIEAIYRRGLIYLDKSNFDEATLDFEKIKQIDNKSILGQIGLTLILKRKGEWQKAEDIYSDLIYDNRTDADLYLNRAECYIETKKLARAQEDLNKALSYGSNDPMLYILRGRLRILQYDKSSARKDFIKARELGADDAVVDELLRHCK